MKLKLPLFFIALLLCSGVYAQKAIPFAPEIKAFKQQDSVDMPKPGQVLFIGASSIRLWPDLKQRFASVPIVQRGVGGSELWQWVDYFMPSIVYPYKPRKIFLYAGENDIAVSKKTAAQVYASFLQFHARLRQQMPDVQFYYMSIKPCPSRLKFREECAALDKMVKGFISTHPKNNTYVNLSNTVLNAQMMPDSSLFKKDMLHLNDKGYDKWQAVLQPYVK